LLERKRLLIVCHGSTVRVLANILLGMPQSESKKFKVPNSTPLVIDLEEGLKVSSWKILGDRAQIAQKMKSVDHELKKED
jgi:bisphosphoglycerate-dependent phosphoglycerate mutase